MYRKFYSIMFFHARHKHDYQTCHVSNGDRNKKNRIIMGFTKLFFVTIMLSIMMKPLLAESNKKIEIIPTLSATWDRNLGFCWGGGLVLGEWELSSFKGYYSSLAFSQKGYNLSAGQYLGFGFGSSRIGINRMVLKKDMGEKVFWGAEATPGILLFQLRGGFMMSSLMQGDHLSTKLNLAGGFGLF